MIYNDMYQASAARARGGGCDEALGASLGEAAPSADLGDSPPSKSRLFRVKQMKSKKLPSLQIKSNEASNK